MRALTECCPALVPPQQRRKAQNDCGRAAVEPWATWPHIALCRCPQRCALLPLKWAEEEEGEGRPSVEGGEVKRGNKIDGKERLNREGGDKERKEKAIALYPSSTSEQHKSATLPIF